jgi:3-phosphoshikimate 1-carboxyvinyltransferase
MKHNLEAMGAVFKVEGDSVIIEGRGRLKGAPLNSFGDHRTCMASVVASFAADGPSEIDDTTCVSKSFPDFFKILSRIKE